MMMDAARQALLHLVSHPALLAHAARNAVRRELTIPLALLRWAIERRPPGKGPERIDLTDASPALGVGLTVDLYGTKIDVSVKIDIEGIDFSDGALTLTLRARELGVTAPPGSPAAMMLGSLDFSHPATLLKMMPAKHTALVSAEDDRFVLDLMKIKPLGKNPLVRRIAAALSFVRVTGSRTADDALALALDVSPTRIPEALYRATSRPE